MIQIRCADPVKRSILQSVVLMFLGLVLIGALDAFRVLPQAAPASWYYGFGGPVQAYSTLVIAVLSLLGAVVYFKR